MVAQLAWLAGLVIGSLFAESCDQDDANKVSPGTPDKPLPLPDLSKPPDMGRSPDVNQCSPDPCSSKVVIPNPQNPKKATCVKFAEKHVATGLKSAIAHRKAEIADYDKDGRADVFLLNDGTPNQMFRNLQNGFTDVTGQIGLQSGGDHNAASFNDYDKDGDFDLLVGGDSGVQLYEQANQSFRPPNQLMSFANGDSSHAVTWMDDNVLAGTANGIRYLKHQGGGKFVESTNVAGLSDPGEAYALAPGDYDRDGHKDVYVANNTGQNRLFRSKGDGTFESTEMKANVIGRGNSVDAQWIPLPGQKLPSLHVVNGNQGNQFFINQPNGVFQDKAAVLGVRDAGQTIAAVPVNLPNLEWPAIYSGRWDQENLFYMPQKDPQAELGVRYVDRAFPLGLNAKGQTVAVRSFDYNNDGLTDLLAVMADGGIFLYENQSEEINVCP